MLLSFSSAGSGYFWFVWTGLHTACKRRENWSLQLLQLTVMITDPIQRSRKRLDTCSVSYSQKTSKKTDTDGNFTQYCTTKLSIYVIKHQTLQLWCKPQALEHLFSCLTRWGTVVSVLLWVEVSRILTWLTNVSNLSCTFHIHQIFIFYYRASKANFWIWTYESAFLFRQDFNWKKGTGLLDAAPLHCNHTEVESFPRATPPQSALTFLYHGYLPISNLLLNCVVILSAYSYI